MTSYQTKASVAILFVGLASWGTGQTTEDKYVWLEDVSSARSMAWVKEHDSRTEKELKADPSYGSNYTEALKIGEDPNRLVVPIILDGELYNEWRDEKNPRGLLRKTTLDDYQTEAPAWHSVIDFDGLGKAESAAWVSHGLECLAQDEQHCMVELSAGGEDASTDREFDLKTGHFVEGGFVLPHSKQQVDWMNKDALVVTRDWGPATLTKSGYPFVVKRWTRGTPLESAKEIFRGAATDEIGSFARIFRDSKGNSVTVIRRGVTFFESETYIVTRKGVERLEIPRKSEVVSLIGGRILVRLHQDWSPEGERKTFAQGSLVELKRAEVLLDPRHLKPNVVFAPSATEFLDDTEVTKNYLILTTLENVQGKAYVYTVQANAWTRKRLPVENIASVRIVSTSHQDDRVFISVTSFLTPPSMWLGNAAAGTIAKVKSQPAQFDSSREVVEQLFATSKDGTKVPYFVVRRKDLKYDGSNPTLLTAYGGFEVSSTPYYPANNGKLWLEKGGVFVLANIRGGGEFGPAWHEAGLKTNRQRIYDDFAAVGMDLIARKITSPRRLGISGASNGGLLMGVEMEQRPDLWNAVVIGVPLLDMLGYEHIAAGASWIGEYGSVNNPGERAFLAAISPYNQLKANVKYPGPLIFTTTKDDRVGPQHARKFAAKMEEFQKPFLYEEITEGGHGAGADVKEEAQTTALIYTYLARKLID